MRIFIRLQLTHVSGHSTLYSQGKGRGGLLFNGECQLYRQGAQAISRSWKSGSPAGGGVRGDFAVGEEGQWLTTVLVG